jgi:hypothetical protein
MRQTNALRAVVSLAVGLFITFSQSHHAAIGLTALAIFGIAFAASNAIGSAIWGKGLVAIEAVPLTIVSLLIGALAILVPQNDDAKAKLAFVGLITVWGLVSGAFELYLARRSGFKTPVGRDYLLSATLSIVLGFLFLVAPLDIVSAVGFFGAYLVISGVQLGVAAASPVVEK